MRIISIIFLMSAKFCPNGLYSKRSPPSALNYIGHGNFSSIFGRYVNIPKEISAGLEKVFKDAPKYPRIADLIPYKEVDIDYLYYRNSLNGDEVICDEPAYSRSPLFQTFNFYRVKETTLHGKANLVITSILGKTAEDNITIEFYEKNNRVFIKINDLYYEPVKGEIKIEELESLLYNYTSLWYKYN